MKTRIDFKVHTNNEFGIGLCERKAHLGFDAEDTFMNIWKSLPKRLDRQWFMIEFEFEGELFSMPRCTFRETDFNFWQSVEREIA